MVRHSREDAISDAQFDRMFDAADDMPEPYRLDCLYILITAGRLGLRAGELCHLEESWVNWERDQLEIPSHQPCEKGRDGGPCGYCRHQSRQSVEKTGVDYETAIKRMWSPKTSTAARAVPFGFDDRVETVLEEFFMFRDGFERSRSAVNRRVDRVLDAVGLPRSTCYPHSLRATAAIYHATRGLNTAALQALMGWNQLATAQKYVLLSGEQTRRALMDAHGSD